MLFRDRVCRVSAAALALDVRRCPLRSLAQVQQPTFKSGTEVVSLFVTVADASGRLVPDLTMEDFEIFDNGKPQPIVYFENVVQPITAVVMLDTSGSMTASISLMKDAAEQFFLRLLPADRARVGAFNDKIEISAHFTNNRDALISDMQRTGVRQRHAIVGRGRHVPRRVDRD